MRHGKWQNSHPLTFDSHLPPLQSTRELAESGAVLDGSDSDDPHFFAAIRTILLGWGLMLAAAASYLIYAG